jgi:hypothetical protein
MTLTKKLHKKLFNSLLWVIFKYSVSISQERCYVYIIKTIQFLPFTGITTFYSENHMEQLDMLSVQNAEILMLKQVVHIVTTALQRVNTLRAVVTMSVTCFKICNVPFHLDTLMKWNKSAEISDIKSLVYVGFNTITTSLIWKTKNIDPLCSQYRSRKPRLRPLGIRRTENATPLYPQKLAPTSPTSGGHTVGIARLRTKATELVTHLHEKKRGCYK